MRHDPVGALTAIIAIVTLPIGILSAVFVSLEAAIVVFVVGWFLLVPLLPIVTRELLPALRGAADEQDEETEEPDPVAALRQRYVDGEIDDEEFERRLDRLIDSEDVPAKNDGEAVRALERERE